MSLSHNACNLSNIPLVRNGLFSVHILYIFT